MNVLNNVRILSFNHFLMGPLAMQHLADLGADVIAVEPIDGAFQRKWGGANTEVDGQSALLLTANRNKKSIALDLKSPEGLAIAKKLVMSVDVVCENYRPGVMERMGLGYEQLKAIKPDIIYATGSGYGSDGPCANEPGQDLLIQAASGLATVTGTHESGPRPVGVSVVDHHGAALMAMGILAAMVRRMQTGVGGRVEVSLLDSAIDLQAESFTCYLNGTHPDVRPSGSSAGWYFPAPYGVYRATDGHIAISLGELRPLYEALEIPESDRMPSAVAYEKRDAINLTVAAKVAQRDCASLLKELATRGVWHSRINDYADVPNHPQVRHLDKFRTVTSVTGAPITLVSNPLRFDGKSPEIQSPPQKLGAQTRELLTGLGYSDREIATLIEGGAVGVSDEPAPQREKSLQSQ
jgi:crotonobetainyl-CoA:carnitine CoA-transferase CaiB-like acyl-CoA transferase